jgi:hypothetical protein
MSKRLDELLNAATERAIADGCTCDDTPNGCISQWVDANCSYRPGTKFFIVLGIACRIADREAQGKGFQSNSRMAAALAFAKAKGGAK